MSKISVIGAGAVGSATAYALLIQEVTNHVVLYDVATEKVEAEVLDLAHGTLYTGASRITGGSDIQETAGSDLVIITAGAKQKPGQSRLDLAGTNTAILQNLLPQLLNLSPEAIFILVTNPCDVLATVAQRLSGLPPARVFASGTVLDSARLRWLLAERLGVASASVHAYNIGEHGDSEFALWSQARVGPIPLADWQLADGSRLSAEDFEQIALEVKNAAYRVIQGKGATNYAIGLSAAKIASAILSDSNEILPVSSVLSGYHGISGIALSVPTIVNRSGAVRPLDLAMTAAEQAKLKNSADAITANLVSLGYSLN